MIYCFFNRLKDTRRGYWPLVKKVAHNSVIDMINKHGAASNEIKKGNKIKPTLIQNNLL